MFESVDARTDGRRLEYHPISSPGAFGSGKLKRVKDMIKHITVMCFVNEPVNEISNNVVCATSKA